MAKASTIVMVSPRCGFWGGVERHVYDLSVGLRARGHRVALAHAGGQGRDPEGFAAAFDEVAPIGTMAPLVRDARVVYVHKVDADQVMPHVPSSKKMVFAVHDHDATCVRSHRYLPVGRTPCSRPTGVACVRHGCVVVRDKGVRAGVRLSNPFALARRTRAWSDRGVLVAGSGFLRRTLLDAGVAPERVVVVHPVPPEETEARLPPPEDQVVAFVGQIIRGKGLDLLVQALSTRPNVRLIVAGEGNDRTYVEQMIRQLGMGGRVEMRGPIGPDRVREVYDAARVVVVPSRWPEPFGMVGVEAMRRGRVVVGAWHGGIPEWLAEGETGFGFRPGDVRDLGVALDRALSDGAYERLAEAAVRRAAAGFGFAQMVAQVESVLG